MVMSTDLLRERVAVRMEQEDSSDNEHFEAEEVQVLFRKGKRFCPREEAENREHHVNVDDEAEEPEDFVPESFEEDE
jgi:hypothetical protein